MNYLPELASNHEPPDLYLLSSKDYRCEPPALSSQAGLEPWAQAIFLPQPSKFLGLQVCVTIPGQTSSVFNLNSKFSCQSLLHIRIF
jgi:hypothetical protein